MLTIEMDNFDLGRSAVPGSASVWNRQEKTVTG